MILHFLISLLLSPAHATGEKTAGAEDTAVIAAKAPPRPYSDEDPVQKCVNNLRKAKSSGGTGTLHKYQYRKVTDTNQLPLTCQKGNLDSYKQALKHSLDYCNRKRKAPLNTIRPYVMDCRQFSFADSCEATRQMKDLAEQADSLPGLMQVAKDKFDYFKSSGGTTGSAKGVPLGKVEFTGYYVPQIQASEVRTSEYKYPVYKTPANMITFKDAQNCGKDPVTGTTFKTCLAIDSDNGLVTYQPVPTRREINAEPVGALTKYGLEVAWFKDPVDIAFMQTQGSGSIIMHKADGSQGVRRLNFDDSNGRGGLMLGRILKCYAENADIEPELQAKILEEAYTSSSSMEGIRSYLAKHSDVTTQLMNYNDSYVFFKNDPPEKGPYGTDDIPLTPYHSVAADIKNPFFPTGAMGLIDATPDAKISFGSCDGKKRAAIMSKDTGSAIVDEHLDWYQGEGDDAAAAASDMILAGNLFVMVPKGSGTPVEGCTN